MMLHNEYLTDEELGQLISEAEADLIPAPPELADNILNAIKEMEKQEAQIIQCPKPKALPKEKAKIKKKKNLEFAAYCFRVGMAAAAAIAFIFIMPYLPGLDMSGDADDSYAEMNLWEAEPLNEVQYAEYEALRNCPTREEVLNDANFFQKIFGENGIFTENDNMESL